jgi:hypothetical protein
MKRGAAAAAMDSDALGNANDDSAQNPRDPAFSGSSDWRRSTIESGQSV